MTVAVCTFQRPSLDETLRSLARLQLPEACALHVIVADNDEHDDRGRAIEALAEGLGLDLCYVHAPARNISVARNACLDHCRTDWLAFIDDDEVASPSWLGALFAGRGQAQIAFGQCRALYPPAAPRWASVADFHSNRLAGNDAAWNGYTSNVLIFMPLVRSHALRFAVELGQTGGEDTMFFHAAHQAGASFAYVPDAVVEEPVDPRRLHLGWLLRRRFRSGQVHWLVLGRTGGQMQGALAAGAKLMACLALALAGLGRPDRWRGGVLRAALHAGVVASALGFPLYREYAGAGQPRA